MSWFLTTTTFFIPYSCKNVGTLSNFSELHNYGYDKTTNLSYTIVNIRKGGC